VQPALLLRDGGLGLDRLQLSRPKFNIARRAGGVKSAGLTISRRLPVYPQPRTSPYAAQNVAKGHKRPLGSDESDREIVSGTVGSGRAWRPHVLALEHLGGS
jgi:hypothetical protein